jgi:flagellar biosynthesis component FlhA
MIKLITKIFFIFSILLLTNAAYSDEHDKQAQDQPKPEQQQPTAETEQENKNSSSNANAFVPTETISEDLSVPFPVDI